MNVTLPPPAALQAAQISPAVPNQDATAFAEGNETREKFHSVMGEMIFGQILKAMRKTVGKPAYFHGGRAEEIFTQQLDQVLAEKISEASAERFLEPMYQLWTLGRK
ncbi:MAG TPA: rod-binding protein [Thermoguttaceae bacterium]|nr:rod-binding protein [Thermoguttaceae bacterium]